MLLIADHVAQIADPVWKCVSRCKEDAWVGGGGVSRGGSGALHSLHCHCDSSAVGWLCALMGQLGLPGWPMPPGACMSLLWVWEAGGAGFQPS